MKRWGLFNSFSTTRQVYVYSTTGSVFDFKIFDLIFKLRTALSWPCRGPVWCTKFGLIFLTATLYFPWGELRLDMHWDAATFIRQLREYVILIYARFIVYVVANLLVLEQLTMNRRPNKHYCSMCNRRKLRRVVGCRYISRARIDRTYLMQLHAICRHCRDKSLLLQ